MSTMTVSVFLTIMEDTGDTLDLNLSLVQVNGQRKYGGPPVGWIGPPPPRGSEVFLKIPRDCFEDILLPVVEKIGCVYEIRMMMDFSGTNRGYCFVTYSNCEEAQKAVEMLDNIPLKPGRQMLRARISVDNRKLFVGRIPCDKTKAEIHHEMCRVTDDVKGVAVYQKIYDKSQNRSFAFVEYTSHRAAALAKRTLSCSLLWGCNIVVDWAEPESEVSEDKLAEVKCLFVRNFATITTENSLMAEFCCCMENPDGIKSVKIVRDFAFVDFYTRKDALQAAAVMNGRTVDGFQLEIELAKPRTERPTKGVRQYQPPPRQMRQPKFCLDLLDQVQYTGRKRDPFQCSSGFVNPDMRSDPREVMFHWKMKFPNLSFTTFLSGMCTEEGWGQPNYFLKEIKHRLRHRKMRMFAYRVIIPGLSNRQTQFVFEPLNFLEDKKLAKEYSAIYALSKIRLASLRCQPNRRTPQLQFTAEDVVNFMTFMRSISQIQPSMMSIMGHIDQELSQACSLLSLTGGAEGMQGYPYQLPNVSPDMMPRGLPGSNVPAVYNVGENYAQNYALNQLSQSSTAQLSHFGMPASMDLAAAAYQYEMAYANAGFANKPDVSSNQNLNDLQGMHNTEFQVPAPLSASVHESASESVSASVPVSYGSNMPMAASYGNTARMDSPQGSNVSMAGSHIRDKPIAGLNGGNVTHAGSHGTMAGCNCGNVSMAGSHGYHASAAGFNGSHVSMAGQNVLPGHDNQSNTM